MKKTITVLPDLPLLFGCGSSDRQWNDGVKYAPRWKKNQWQFQVSKLEVSTIIFLAHLIGLCKGIYYIYPPIYIWLYMGQYLHFGSWNSPLAWQPKFHSFLSWNLGRSFEHHGNSKHQLMLNEVLSAIPFDPFIFHGEFAIFVPCSCHFGAKSNWSPGVPAFSSTMPAKPTICSQPRAGTWRIPVRVVVRP